MQHSVGKKRACGYEKMEKRVPLVGHSMGLRSLTMDSLAFWALGRFCQVPGCTRSDMAMSSKNMCVISALISREYIITLLSKLCSKLRKSKLAEPTDMNSSSTITVLACSMPAL